MKRLVEYVPRKRSCREAPRQKSPVDIAANTETRSPRTNAT